YDALFARLLDESGVHILLVGDSVNQVLAGAETTLSATLEQMIYHTRIVRRGTSRALVVCDLPFLSYQISREEAIKNAGRVMAETGCHAVKLEGGKPMAQTVRALVDVGIPVMGHLGLTPQSVHAVGGIPVRSIRSRSDPASPGSARMRRGRVARPMHEITKLPEMRAWSRAERAKGRRIGVVPTMGSLHEGHLRLVDRARDRADRVVLSLFVNPLQFGPQEDFVRYPRNLARDRGLAAQREVDCLFAPDTAAMYAAEPLVRVSPGPLGEA